MKCVAVVLPWLLLVGIMAAACSGCGEKRAKAVATEKVVVKSDFTDEATAWVDSVLEGMSVSDRVGQLLMPASYTSTDRATIRQLRSYADDYKVGGVVFLKGSAEDMDSLTRLLSAGRDVPMFYAVDAENGLSMRLTGTSRLPDACELQSASEEELYEMGLRTGEEARGLGINMVLGPVLDVCRDGNSVMRRRSYGTNPAVVASLATAFARGLHDGGVIPVGKHFPGHGATNVDSHSRMPIVGVDKATFERVDLLPFSRYISTGNDAIMVGHVAVPSLTGDSVPASLSKKLVTDLLRGRMGYRGLVFTDAMNMGGVKRTYDTSVEALLAGADVILVPEDTDRAFKAIVEAVEKGVISHERLNESVRRVLLCKYALRR